MLVVSRKEREKIVFPTIGASVEVLLLKGNVARLGISAPRDLPILRGELAVDESKFPSGAAAAQAEQAAQRERDHKLRNELNVAALGLSLLRRQLQAGQVEAADTTLENLINQMGTLRQIRSEPQPNAVPSKYRALLVEDDDNERNLLAGLLRTQGFEVESASDGAEALTLLAASQRPDVVLMDMLMPRCDGPTTIRTIRRNPRFAGLKIYAVSGTAPANLGVEIGPAGIDHWFPKPLDPERFLSALSSAAEGVAI